MESEITLIPQSNNSAATPLKSAKLQTWEWLLRGRLRRGAHCDRKERDLFKCRVESLWIRVIELASSGVKGSKLDAPRERGGGGERVSLSNRLWEESSDDRSVVQFFFDQSFSSFDYLENWKTKKRENEELGESKLKRKEEKFDKLDYIYEERLTIFGFFLLLIFSTFHCRINVDWTVKKRRIKYT